MIDPATILFGLAAAGLKAVKARSAASGVEAGGAGGAGAEIGAELLTVLFAHHATDDIRRMQERFAEWLKGPAPHKNQDLERAIARCEILADFFCLIEALPGGIQDAEHKSWLRSVAERLPETLKRSEARGFFADIEKAQIRAAEAVCEARLKVLDEKFEPSEIEPSMLLKRKIDRSFFEKLGREAADSLEGRETSSGHKIGALPERVHEIFARQWFSYLTQAFRHELKSDGPVYRIYTTMRLESGFEAVEAAVRDEGQKTRDHIDLALGQRLLTPRRTPINLPFLTLGGLFKGRDVELAQLDQQLRLRGAFAITQPQAMSGLGGIGKTRLAIEYAWHHQNDFDALLFVSANTDRDLVTNLATLSAESALDLPEQGGQERDQYDAVVQWLRNNKGWLLILDNVDTREGVHAVQELVSQISGGRVMITSRYARWGEGIRKLSLDVIPLADATALLLEKTHGQRKPRPDDEREAKVLAARVGCLPLALTHAAAYVAEYELGFPAYLAEFDQALQYFDPEVIKYDTEVLKTVATTFFLSFDRLSATEKAILRAASFLAPDPIPVAMFEGTPDELKALVDLWCDEKGEAASEKSVRNALTDLARFSLVTRGDGVFSVHRMEQLVLRSAVQRDRVPNWIEATRAVLVRYAPDETAENPETWPIWDTLRPHAEALVALAQADARVTPNLDLMGALGQLYYGKGSYTQSLVIDEAMLPLAEKIYGPDSGDLAHRLLSYGESLHQLGRNGEAEAAFRKSLAIREVSDGPDSLRVAEDLNYVAMAVEAQGRLDEAEALQRHAIQIFETHSENADKGSFAKSLNNLGNLLHAKGLLAEAETLKRRSVQLAEEGFGPDNPKTLICVTTLALLLEAKGDGSEAGALFARAVDGFSKSLGLDHPMTLQALMSYANYLGRRNELVEAEKLYRQLLSANERLQGSDGEGTLIALNNVGWVLQAAGNLPEAEGYFRRALEVREGISGRDHPQTLNVVHNLGMLFKARGESFEAIPLFRRALEARERVLGANHQDTLASIVSLADILAKTGQDEEARQLRLEHRRRLVTRPNATSLQLRQLALGYYRDGEYAEAADLLRKVLENGFQMPTTHCLMARALTMMDRLDDARRHIGLAREHPDDGLPYAMQRILFFEILFTLLDGQPLDNTLSPMAIELARPEALMEWDIEKMLEHLRGSLSPEANALLTALSRAINDRKAMPELEAQPAWQRAVPVNPAKHENGRTT